MAAAAASSSPGAIASGLLWSKTLTTIPDNFAVDQVNKYYAARKTTERNRRRSYKIITESFVEPSSLETAIVNNGNVSSVVARGQCYASQRKSSKPYRASTTIAADGWVSTSSCHCAAKEGLCNHSLALLQMIALLKKEGYREAPQEVTCTELPQQWRRPRGSQINPGSVGDLDWRSVREGGPSEALSSKLYDARKSKKSITDMQQDLHTLGVDLGHIEDSPFAKHLRSLEVLGTDSMFGVVPEGSGISYQHPVSQHEFTTYVNPNIVQCGTDASKTVLPTWPVLFTSANTYQLETEILGATKTLLLQDLVLTPEQARQLEMDSRQQAKSTARKAARTNRLTASSLGTVVTRESWTDVELRNLTEVRDLSRIRAAKKMHAQEYLQYNMKQPV
ncbi:uncharacterized protein LOC121837660 [Ixodes scapularis]|uniref:uncharacterized protein LOC121837660 n=1 Tax=Ixodes scapularis TaxID=6945 RepID=UPI001C392C72|nr:uncharacterized protein LOC121837660 [Ixodes scapularis]